MVFWYELGEDGAKLWKLWCGVFLGASKNQFWKDRYHSFYIHYTTLCVVCLLWHVVAHLVVQHQQGRARSSSGVLATSKEFISDSFSHAMPECVPNQKNLYTFTVRMVLLSPRVRKDFNGISWKHACKGEYTHQKCHWKIQTSRTKKK